MDSSKKTEGFRRKGMGCQPASMCLLSRVHFQKECSFTFFSLHQIIEWHKILLEKKIFALIHTYTSILQTNCSRIQPSLSFLFQVVKYVYNTQTSTRWRCTRYKMVTARRKFRFCLLFSYQRQRETGCAGNRVFVSCIFVALYFDTFLLYKTVFILPSILNTQNAPTHINYSQYTKNEKKKCNGGSKQTVGK